jgi:hypothetical protein
MVMFLLIGSPPLVSVIVSGHAEVNGVAIIRDR